MIEFDLASVRADGWFERVGKEIGSFVPLCDAVGEKFVAFSIVAGVRITAITIDRRNPANTVVDFTVGEGGAEQRLPLGEFRRRLVAALLGDDPSSPRFSSELKPEEVAAFIGSRYVLLAPLYGYSLQKIAGEAGKDRDARITFARNDATDTVSLVELRDRLRSEVRRELNRAREGPFALDLNRVDQAADAAAKGNHAQVIELLGSWPGPLSLLLRTPAGAALGQDQRSLIAKGLLLLGNAYGEEGKLGWAEELFRLGLQYDNSGPMGSALFLRLARTMIPTDRYGEAIGPFRRALALGASREEVFPMLGRAFLRRGRLVAAVACLESARTAGVSTPEVRADLEEAYSRLGPAGVGFRALQGAGAPTKVVAPAPPPTVQDPSAPTEPPPAPGPTSASGGGSDAA